MKVFSNFSALRAASLTAGQQVTTKGWHEPGDGGNALYLIKTAAEYGGSPDNYGDGLLANGNVAVLQTEGSVNVKQFGATGDYNTGTQTGTDNRAAFEAAAAWVDAYGDGTLIISDGDYLLGNSWNIMYSNFNLVITPDATVRVNAATSRGHCLAFASPGAVAGTGYGTTQIENVSISGGGTVIAEDLGGGDNENAIAFVDCKNFRCDGMNIPTANHKAITAQINVQNGWITNNHIGTACVGGKSGTSAISVQGSFDVVDAALPIENIYIENNLIESASSTGNGIYAIQSFSTVARDVVIKNNIIRSCGGSGVEVRGFARPVVLDNYSVGGQGVIFRDCYKIKANVHCDNVDNFGLHILTFSDADAQGFHIGEVRVGTSCGQDAVRITSVKGGGYIEKVVVTSTNHESIYRVVGSTLTDKVLIPGGLVGTDGSVSRVNVPSNAYYPWLPIETIENSNGIAVKYPDGTMICTRDVDYDFTTATNALIDMPATFTSNANAAISFQNTSTGGRVAAFVGTCVMASTNQWRVANTVTQAETLQVRLVATGRWRDVETWDAPV